MQDQIILYNGPNSPFGRKTKITSLVQEINLEEKIINVYESDSLDKHNPLRNENALSSVCGVEYAAQAMAVHGALSKSDPDEEPRPGYLASIKNLDLLVSSLDDIESDLVIEAELLMRDKEFLVYQFRVLSEDLNLLSGRAIISIKGNSIN